MKLLPIEEIQINYEKIKEIDYMVKSIYRLIIFSRHHEDDDLLDSFFNGMHELTELLNMYNANEWNDFTSHFFDLELDRLLLNAKNLYSIVDNISAERKRK